MTDARLPQLEHRLFVTDSGLETTLIFHDGMALPEFAAFPLVETPAGRERLADYFKIHLDIARGVGAGFVAEAPTWRANRDWGTRLGYDERGLAVVNRAAISLLADIRERAGQPPETFVISGCIGPRGDGYRASETMAAAEAESYHREQIQTFADTPVDLVSALTLTYVDEAIGVTRAAQACGIPVVISFTVETDGRLPSGAPLGRAIDEVDDATGQVPAYYMINCAHPSHFASVLHAREPWVERIRGIRANASKLSHAELDAATDLDDGDPDELGREYAQLLAAHSQLTIVGGCCGTDDRHVAAITRHCATEPV